MKANEELLELIDRAARGLHKVWNGDLDVAAERIVWDCVVVMQRHGWDSEWHDLVTDYPEPT